MPKCKNGSGYYKGSEPSPKGRGFCAHNLSEGARKIGIDKKFWKVVTGKDGVKRWVKVDKKHKRKAPEAPPAAAASTKAHHH